MRSATRASRPKPSGSSSPPHSKVLPLVGHSVRRGDAPRHRPCPNRTFLRLALYRERVQHGKGTDGLIPDSGRQVPKAGGPPHRRGACPEPVRGRGRRHAARRQHHQGLQRQDDQDHPVTIYAEPDVVQVHRVVQVLEQDRTRRAQGCERHQRHQRHEQRCRRHRWHEWDRWRPAPRARTAPMAHPAPRARTGPMAPTAPMARTAPTASRPSRSRGIDGFSGTLAEWLASLKGADGTNGTDGHQRDRRRRRADGAHRARSCRRRPSARRATRPGSR